MGQRGPKPTPTNILALRGSTLVPRRTGEPRPKVQAPSCPAWVSPEGKAHWKDIAGILEGLQVLTVGDRAALGLLVDALARYIECKRAVYGIPQREDGDPQTGTGLTTTNAAGTLVKHPLAALMLDSWEQVLRACREFGLTPSSRTGVRLMPVIARKAEGHGDKKPKAKARLFSLG